MKTSMFEALPAIDASSPKAKPLTIVKPSSPMPPEILKRSATPMPPEILKRSATPMPPEILKLPATPMPSLSRTTTPTSDETARAQRRARALRSKTVIAIYLVVTLGVGAALLEMHGRASRQAAARPAPHRVVPAPVAAPAPAAEAPHTRGPIAPAPPGAPAPWGGWIG